MKVFFQKNRYYFFGIGGGIVLVGIVFVSNIGLSQYRSGADIFGLIGNKNGIEPQVGEGAFIDVEDESQKQAKIKEFISSNWRDIAIRATNNDAWTDYEIIWIQDKTVKLRLLGQDEQDVTFNYSVFTNGDVGFQIVEAD